MYIAKVSICTVIILNYHFAFIVNSKCDNFKFTNSPCILIMHSTYVLILFDYLTINKI